MRKESPARKRIMDTASRLFYQQGFNATGINQIIAEADIAIGTLYKHFPSKMDLLHAYVEERDERWLNDLEGYLKKVKGGPVDKLLAIFDYRIQMGVANGFRGCPFVKICNEIPVEEPKVFRQVSTHKNRLLSLLMELTAKLPAKPGRLDSAKLAEAIFYLMEGAGVTNLINQDKKAMMGARDIAGHLIGA